jgi:hypothetical protein
MRKRKLNSIENIIYSAIRESLSIGIMAIQLSEYLNKRYSAGVRFARYD